MALVKNIIFLSLLALTTGVQAAPVTVLLEAEVFSGDFLGTTATGTLIYDDDAITGSGLESVSAADGLDVEFILFGQTFTESNDIDFDSKPSLDFEDGVIVGFDWVVSEIEGDTLTDIVEDGVFDFFTLDVVQEFGPGGEILISGELFINEFSVVVPIPAALPLFAAGLGLLAGYRRRKG